MADLIGPVGGNGGNPFQDPTNQEIQEIMIHWGSQVDSITVTFKSGQTTHHGGTGGENEREFDLEEGEYITQIWGNYDGEIKSIAFVTNQGRTHGPFGPNNGNVGYKLLACSPSHVIGFFGRAGSYLDAIGLIVGP